MSEVVARGVMASPPLFGNASQPRDDWRPLLLMLLMLLMPLTMLWLLFLLWLLLFLRLLLLVCAGASLLLMLLLLLMLFLLFLSLFVSVTVAVAVLLLLLLLLVLPLVVAPGTWNRGRRPVAGGYLVMVDTGGFNVGVSWLREQDSRLYASRVIFLG